MKEIRTQIAVLGGGPAGYTAAFYAADKGKKVVLIDKDRRLGGVCLNTGCIPSKALLHACEIVAEAKRSAARGIDLGAPKIDIAKLRTWKEGILSKLGQGIATLADKRNVLVLQGEGRFSDSNTLQVATATGTQAVRFEKAIVATGSRPVMPEAFRGDRIMSSTEALALADVPRKLLVLGGGYIGMELGSVYAALGSKVTLVEAMPGILTGVDPDLIRPVMRAAEQSFASVRVGAKLKTMTTKADGVHVALADGSNDVYDKVLVSIGRTPNTGNLGLEKTKVAKGSEGFLETGGGVATADPAIYAIGDVAGQPMLAHKASMQARAAVDAILGDPPKRASVIPAVVFTDPEIAWCGMTETLARTGGLKVQVARFPWSASGRALSMDRAEGMTKLILDPQTEKILGVGIVGAGAGELIAEGVLAVQQGMKARDLADCVHPHPTRSETLQEAAEVFYGLSASVLPRRR